MATETTYHQIYDHANNDYPLAIYFLDPDNFFSNSIPWHWHNELELDLIREGSAVYVFGNDSLTANEGDSVLIKSNVFHSIVPKNNDCKIISIIFSPSLIFGGEPGSVAQNYIDFVNNPKDNALHFTNNNKFGKSVISYIREIIDLNLQKDFGYDLLTKSAMYQLWYLLVKDMPRFSYTGETAVDVSKFNIDDVRIKDALSFIHENYAAPLALDEIAESVHLSKSECCRLFKRIMGQTPFEYLLHYRIAQACDIMINSQRNDESISDLACRVGFNSASYFNKLFKEYIGCTPSDFRKQSKTERRDKLSTFGLSFNHL